MQNGTYEQIVTHLERELELNGLEAPDELPINNVNQKITNTKADRPKPTCHHCKKPRHYRNQCRLLKKSENKLKMFKIILETRTVALEPLTRTVILTTTTTTTTTKTVTESKESQKLFTHPSRHVEKPTTLQRDSILEPMQPTDRLPGTKDRKDKIRCQKKPT